MGRLIEPPFGVLAVVYRQMGPQREFLLFHRAHRGPEYEGDWAWGPPGGSREADETAATCAWRELREETGLDLPVHQVAHPDQDWAVYLAEAPANAGIMLSDEHDRFIWASAEKALTMTSPEIIVAELNSALQALDRER